VTPKGILEHERRFQAIAEAHGNTRAGTPGYRESREYVAERLRRAGYGVRVQSFKFPFFRVLAPLELARVSPDPHAYELREDFAPMQYSGSGEVTAQLEPVDISPSPGGEPGPSTSGCEEPDFTGFDGSDVAFLQRGTCTFEEKAKNAEAAGASAVLIFNRGEENKTETIRGALGKPGVTIPVLGTSFAVGEDLVRMTQGGDVTIRVFASTVSETREASNVIAETEEGREDQTVVVGAHLDSVPEGPGINDNGSGSAAVLEIAEKMSELGIEPRNRVRFAFWGAEELGLFGSKYYMSQLDDRQLGDLAVYLNFDMVASPNYVRFIYGSGEVREVFENFFASRDLKVKTVDLKGGLRPRPVRRRGHPRRRPLQWRRKQEDGEAGRSLRRRGGRRLRQVLPRGLRRRRQPQYEGPGAAVRRRGVRHVRVCAGGTPVATMAPAGASPTRPSPTSRVGKPTGR
jgi:hypothetical protein